MSVERALILLSRKWFLERDPTETKGGTDDGYNSFWDDGEEDYPE